ncbi:hypothetical protein UC35_15350 [Ramlibacter tataouinensis]|uniref:Uncharacterized protein n=1 Tax=Ramlibacter tataouinensis TaxID=94132 RepID=A0A127JVQ8_9BURK|nr:hypothetical protein UC35_15350 [Ramlibacter tataouinensis]
MALALVGCVDGIDVTLRDRDLERVATRFGNLADSCLIDVRDNKLPYARSANCRALGEVSKEYTSHSEVLLYYDDRSAPRHAYLAASAKARAWSAATLSNAWFRNQPPVVSLW